MLIWVENSPFRFRYLVGITDPNANYSDKWIDISDQIPEKLRDNYYFAGGFTFPRWRLQAYEDDQPYILMLPKNYTSETVAKFRRVRKTIPFELEEKVSEWVFFWKQEF